MEIRERMSNLNPHTFIQDYMKLCNIKEEDFNDFLFPTIDLLEDPINYDNMNEGYELLSHHISKESKIGLVLHLDMDSMLSNVITYQYLRDLNPNADIEVFFPQIKPQGLNKVVVQQVLNSDVDLLILTDACSSDLDEFKLFNTLNNLGWKHLDCIVLDHHSQAKGKDDVNKYCCLINNQLSKNVINKKASGTLVTWKFMNYADQMYDIDYSYKYLDLVAMSIVSDVCDTTSLENRFMLHYGFNDVNNLLLLNATREFVKDSMDRITIDSMGWKINPKFNGIIKSGDVNAIEALFFGFVEPDKITNWEQGTKRISKKNGLMIDRVMYLLKNMGAQKSDTIHDIVDIIKDELDFTQKVVTIFSNNRFPFSMGGDIASRVKDITRKPCLCFMDCDNDKYYTGSCRSNIPLKELMQESGLFVFCEGHSPAFGFKIKKSNISKLQNYISTLDLESETTYEVIKKFDDTNVHQLLFESIQANLERFGKGFEQPLFYFSKLKINSRDIQVMGKVGVTFKFFVDDICFIKFFANKDIKNDFRIGENKNIEVDIIGKLSINEWNGECTNQVIIEKYEVRERETKKLEWKDIF